VDEKEIDEASRDFCSAFFVIITIMKKKSVTPVHNSLLAQTLKT